MTSKYVVIFTLAAIGALFSPVVSFAQTYAEMDAEAVAADKRLWQSAFLDPIGKRVAMEFDAGNYESAIREANKFLAFAPSAWGGIQLIRGRAHLELYKKVGHHLDLMRARADFLHALRNKPDDVWGQIYLGELYLTAHRGFEANRQYDKALAIDPNSFRALFGKSKASFFARDYKGCVSAGTKLMAHAEYSKENDAWAYLRLGECYASLGDKVNAKQNFDRAVTVQPGLKDSWHYQAFLKDGYSCKKLGRKSPDKPFERFTAVLRSSYCPDSLPVLFDPDLEKDPNLKDFVLFYRAEFDRRINKSESSDTLGYEDAKAYLREARWLHDQAKRSGKPLDEKNLIEILEYLNHAVNIKSRNDDVLQEDVDAVARVMRAKLLLSHSDRQIQILAWREQIALSNISKAELQMNYAGGRVAQRPLYKNGADVNSAMLRGMVYSVVKQNHRAALAEFDGAIRTLETVYVKPNFTTDAPIFAEVYMRRGEVLERLGNVFASAEAYVKALEISPSNAEAKDGLKRLEEKEASSGKTAQATALGQILVRSRINEISERVSEAERSFRFTTSSLQNKPAGIGRARELCNAVSVYLRALSAERGKLSALGSSIDRSSKLWQNYKTNLDNLDLKIRNVSQGSASCSNVN